MALITGINRQDDSYLAEIFLAKGHEVHGIIRREATEDPKIISEMVEHNIALIRNSQ